MTGTAFTEASEFLEVYQLKVLPIPTALPVARRDNPDAGEQLILFSLFLTLVSLPNSKRQDEGFTEERAYQS